MIYQTSQVSLPTPASGTRNPEGGYPPDEKKFSVTSRMGPVFISVVSGNLRPIENAGSGGRKDETYVLEKSARVSSSSDDFDMFGPSG